MSDDLTRIPIDAGDHLKLLAAKCEERHNPKWKVQAAAAPAAVTLVDCGGNRHLLNLHLGNTGLEVFAVVTEVTGIPEDCYIIISLGKRIERSTCTLRDYGPVTKLDQILCHPSSIARTTTERGRSSAPPV